MFLFKDIGQQGTQAVENALTRAFRGSGYNVLDAGMVAQTLRRDADLLQRYEIEAAKRLGSRLGADIVVSGELKAKAVEKTYTLLEGKKLTMSQADVSAKAVLVSTGKVVAAETVHARKPFDITGDAALQKAAEALAGKLLQGIEQFLTRDTIDYRLVIVGVGPAQLQTLQEALRNRVQGVRQVQEQGFIENTLELDVSVDKRQDVAFKTGIDTQLSALGLGRFDVAAREGETIYLRRTGGQSRKDVGTPPPAPPSDTGSGKLPDGTKRTGRDSEGEDTKPPPVPAAYKRGYRKSWAVVVGINDYQTWEKLEYAVNDAQAMTGLLKRLGFDEVITLLDRDATQKNILRVLGDDLYEKTDAEDRVFIFFAGHGQTQDLPNGKEGYIIPVDGDLKNYYSTAISMPQLQRLGDRIRAKHLFYAMDSCFSGLLLSRTRGGAPDDPTTVKARQVLTAGSEGEKVVEVAGHGLFTKMLLAGLEGAADLDHDGYVRASELYKFITPRVLEESRNKQNPGFGQISTGDGEVIFKLAR
jgi:hypothetical protein